MIKRKDITITKFNPLYKKYHKKLKEIIENPPKTQNHNEEIYGDFTKYQVPVNFD